MIVAGIEGQDNSFFLVESRDISAKVLNHDIISFSYIEEMNRYNTGTLSIYDPDHYYSKVLRFGANLRISFGYNKPDLSGRALLLKDRNPNQVFGDKARTGISAYITNPSGKAGSDGVVTFNCNFYGGEYLAAPYHRVHVGMTKANFVKLLMQEMGCKQTEVNFSRGKEFLNANTQIFQRETNYRLLMRYAMEWRALFRLSYNKRGELTGAFVSPEYVGNNNIPKLMAGAIGGNSIFLEWREGVANVIEYSWKNHMGSSGMGDNVRMMIGPDGTPQFIRYVAEGQKVKAYKLNPERIKGRLKAAKTQSERGAMMKEWLAAEDFSQVAWAFDPYVETTAPQGLGYSMEVKKFGNPLCSSPLRVLFGEGFPIWFTPAKPDSHITNFYATKVEHTISREGYKNNLSIADAYTISGGTLVG